MIIASCVSQVADLPFVRFVVSHAEHALEFLENTYIYIYIYIMRGGEGEWGCKWETVTNVV